ncbi:M23 family metallopeptidase [Cellulomonas endophytica]|uniref:M23 family metallopeptidase n=1 Tax=Cellulomonas endophytica TaxID=2494735 RepID=UPI001F0BF55B|nr:M23 family metallopeptidase [Cellulomonas endophytica]
MPDPVPIPAPPARATTSRPPRAGRLAVAGLLVALVLAPWVVDGVRTPAGAASPVAGAVGAGAAGGAAGWRSPVAGGTSPSVLRPFDRPATPYAAGHRGVDLPAGVGDPVLAPAAGVVVFAGPVAGRGVVTVRHADGLRSSLEPVAGAPAVGTTVAAGTAVGTLAAPAGHCPGPCLHWGVRAGEVYLDPMALLGPLPRVVLLPW